MVLSLSIYVPAKIRGSELRSAPLVFEGLIIELSLCSFVELFKFFVADPEIIIYI